MSSSTCGCLILDEAHRIRETSANRYTRASLRTGRPQVDELLAAARVPVFLLDENQVVRPGEMGTVADITAAARERGIAVTHIDLDAQFRCGGSLEFIDWVERLLDLRAEGPRAWNDDDQSYTVQVMDSTSSRSLVTPSSTSAYRARDSV
ncbi:MAG: DNA/RNA helicase domain-containing protein [Lapillicoccus sp.]